MRQINLAADMFSLENLWLVQLLVTLSDLEGRWGQIDDQEENLHMGSIVYGCL